MDFSEFRKGNRKVSGKCSVEKLDTDNGFQVSGWVMFDSEEDKGEKRLLVFENERLAASVPVFERPDVSEFFGRKGNFGFKAELPGCNPESTVSLALHNEKTRTYYEVPVFY